ncbi:oxygen-dependent tRNA uridine(34) hydroxylase TrhO [Candidatus Pantoea carbekii]|uniref:oxygen-dependent tRNA uridine(34) hydroxylase TrhO n=1 Tax=Candidatus Pantoea carbekii TaxID=1235990 RepID=UPI000618788B|nr:rhodanese-related sulfurtransferase [Candidatus Pantoea carbekii]AKC32142.1 rhodanese-like protein [Candidatus Pantoea carbekii]
MSVLHNLICNKKLKQRMLDETETRITVSFYKYFQIINPNVFRDSLYVFLNKYRVFGRIYISSEGINAQISVPANLYESMRQILYTFDPALHNLRMNIALEDNGKSFWVLRIKVRNRIVADGIDDKDFDPSNVGKYLSASEVNSMLDDPSILFVDMRNYYEYMIGHFDNAIVVPASTFRNQLRMAVNMLQHYKNKKIVMYCTGGIRCEKATAWMKYNGFNDVNHIEGGIIGYTRSAWQKGLPVRFKGKNFVFDERMSERISDDVLSYCYQCSLPCDVYTNCKNNNCHLLFIQCLVCAQKYNGCCCLPCYQKITSIV